MFFLKKVHNLYNANVEGWDCLDLIVTSSILFAHVHFPLIVRDLSDIIQLAEQVGKSVFIELVCQKQVPTMPGHIVEENCKTEQKLESCRP